MIIRSLQESDLPTRVAWMNDPRVNATLNIQLPVTLESTRSWFARLKDNARRRDFAFEEGGSLVAMGGLTDIAEGVGKAELYIFVDPDRQGGGVGTKAVRLMCSYGFERMNLHKIYLHTNADSAAYRLYERVGFKLEGFMPCEVENHGRLKDRRYYGLYNPQTSSPTSCDVSTYSSLTSTGDFFLCQDIIIDGRPIKIVRDDVYPRVGGGSKARKAVVYEQHLRAGGYNAVVTTGGIQSNHNRAIALMAARNGWKCHIVYHGTEQRFLAEQGNALLVRLSGAETEFVEVNEIAGAMDAAMERYRAEGLKPYYVTGGGHDLPGGIAFVNAVRELYNYGQANNYKPRYIVHASGTGSTQAGILVGLDLVGWNDVEVVGISVARQQERGRKVIVDFANKLAAYYGLNKDYSDSVIFNTDYIFAGYEGCTPEMQAYLTDTTKSTGLLFDTTYSGKALFGMHDLMCRKELEGDILFWHTGGLMNVLK